MKIITMAAILLCLTGNLTADIYAQGGIESTLGANHLFLLTPWIALRLPLAKSSSLIFKYSNPHIRYRYENSLNLGKQDAHLTNLSAILYFQSGGNDYYTALSFLTGTNAYKAIAFDTGMTIRLSKWLSLEGSFYVLTEKSILWYPHEKVRNITLYSIRTGVKFDLAKWLSLTPRIYVYRNSEDVTATSYSIGLNIMPKYPFIITLSAYRYSESAHYRFSGNYISLGLNFYY